MGDDLKRLNLDPPGPEMRAGLDKLHEQMDMMIEFEQVQAKRTRAKYNAMIKEGFTETQALELCKTL